MSAKILYGRPAASAILKTAELKSKELRKIGVVPKILVVAAGKSRPAQVYLKNLSRKCEEAKVILESAIFSDDVTEEEIKAKIAEAKRNPSIHGIMIYSPLPPQINADRIYEETPLEKDIDGMSSEAQGKIMSGGAFAPCTASAIIDLLDYYDINVHGKRAAIIGRSKIVGIPSALLLLKRNATVTICHTHTNDIDEIIKSSDIVISAAGSPGILNRRNLKRGGIVIDAGISLNSEGKILGDAVFDEAVEVCSMVSPVPGGVGALTAIEAIRNVVLAAENGKRSI